MKKDVIQVENLSKKYFLGEIGARRLLHGLGSTNGNSAESVWALKDVSFSVQQGDVLGIIGRNGAGKSTLLKIISRITTPTEGSIKIKGRIASLLEVGTGFHPDMTGRENVFMNGTLLGMSRAEIQRKLDQIVEFAGVSLFIDTPVKRYSSGMQVRLAFAVAAFLEPEILIVDEVLAVGDLEFQKRAVGRMQEVSKSDGRTVLFVSHNMNSIRQLCSRGILLQDGKVQADGEIASVIEQYSKVDLSKDSFVLFENFPRRSGSGAIQFEWLKITDDQDRPCNQFLMGDTIHLSFALKIRSTEKTSAVAIQIKTLDGIPLVHMMNRDSHYEMRHDAEHEIYSVKIPDIRLYPATYSITLTSSNPGGHELFDKLEDCVTFSVVGGGKLVSRNLPRAAGIFFLTPEWMRVSS